MDSSRDIPGLATAVITKEPSLNSGKKLLPNREVAIYRENPKSKNTRIIHNQALRRKNGKVNLYNLLSLLSTQEPSLRTFKVLFPVNKYELNTGVTVIATKSEVKRETMNAIPNGCNKRPSIPLRNNKGVKERMMINVAITMELLISSEASKTTVSEGFLSASGKWLFSRRRLKTFSTSIMASSTRTPMAIAMPPRLIVLIVYPSK